MDSLADDEPIGYSDVTDALLVLQDAGEWSLTADRWAEVDRSVTALTAALDAGNGGSLRYEIGALELLGPVRAHAGIADATVAAPVAVRVRILNAIETLERAVPVTIFLSDGNGHEQVQRAVELLLTQMGLSIVSRGEPVEGSWFRQLLAFGRSPAGRDALATVLHTADARFVQQPDAQNTALLMQNIGPLIAALQPTKDAVVRIGAFLIVKVDWVLVVHQLTSAQQLMLDHSPQLATAPQEILHALGLHAAGSGMAIPGNPAV